MPERPNQTLEQTADRRAEQSRPPRESARAGRPGDRRSRGRHARRSLAAQFVRRAKGGRALPGLRARPFQPAGRSQPVRVTERGGGAHQCEGATPCGVKSSAVESGMGGKVKPAPAATSTLPSGNSVAVWIKRVLSMAAVSAQVPVAGS